MRTIHKYQLAMVDDQLISMPRDADSLSVGTQGMYAYLWALVENDAPMQDRRIHIRGTGHDCRALLRHEFIGRLTIGVLEFHVFLGDWVRDTA